MRRWQEFIDPSTETLHGKPVFKGTRISVEDVVQRLNDGWTETTILNAYPGLTRDHILAALAYSTRSPESRGDSA